MNAIDCHPSKSLAIARAIELGDEIHQAGDRLVAVTAIDVRYLAWSNGEWTWMTARQIQGATR